MVRILIEANIHKYERIINNSGEMDIYSLDQACADIDRTIGYIRKIIIMIPSILKKMEEKIEEEKKLREKKIKEFFQRCIDKKMLINIKTLE